MPASTKAALLAADDEDMDFVCPIEATEDERLAALARYDLLDSPAEESFDRITRLVKRIFNAPIATISLLDGHRQWFKSRQGVEANETPREPAFCNFTIQNRSVFVVEDAHKDERFSSNPLVTGEPFVRFYAGAPLITADGFALGALCVIDHKARKFSDSDCDTLSEFAKIVMDEIELRQLANVDSLTGALSRRAFRDESQRAVHLAARYGHPLSVVALDLDHFKSINDTYGHAAGDTVLTRTAAACQKLLRGSDALGRLGGEEFAVLLPHADARSAFEVAERLRATVSAELYRLGNKSFRVTASFGISTRSRAVRDIDDLLSEADAALYFAKLQGRDRCVVARPAEAMEEAGARRRVLKGGKITFDRGLQTRDCTIRSMSDRGAGLDVSNTMGLPANFQLAIDSDAVVRSCKIVSVTDRHIEVAFS